MKKLKIFLVLFLIAFCIEGEELNSSEHAQQLDWVINVLSQESPDLSYKDQVINILNDLAEQKYSQAFYYLGEIYYFGLFGEKDKYKAYSNLELGAELGDTSSKYLLGSLLLNEEETSLNKAITLLELAAMDGHQDSVNNLYSLYNNGIYERKEKLKGFVQRLSNIEKFKVMKLYMDYAETQATNDPDKAVSLILNEINNFDFSTYKAEVIFLKAKMFGNESLDIYDFKESTKYLEESANLGSNGAKALWNAYNEKLNQQQNK